MKIELGQECGAVYGLVENPKHALPQNVFDLLCLLTPLINVDLLIFSKDNEILLTWRDDDNFGPGWHVPGGVIRLKESAEERLKLVAKTELNLDLIVGNYRLAHLHEHIAYSKLRGHGFSLLYIYNLVNESDILKYKTFNEDEKYLAGQPAWHKKFPQNLIPEQKFIESIISSDQNTLDAISKSTAIF